jgi:hypothetical protein
MLSVDLAVRNADKNKGMIEEGIQREGTRGIRKCRNCVANRGCDRNGGTCL